MTIVRFQGDDYSSDFIVSESDKQAIRDELTVYDALKKGLGSDLRKEPSGIEEGDAERRN